MQYRKTKRTESSNTLRSYEDFQIRKTIYISLLCVIVGAVAGLGATLFSYLIDLFHNLFFSGTLSISHERGGIISPWGPFIIIVPAIGMALSRFITAKWAPEAKGHGVPEVMVAVTQRQGKIRPVVALVKSLASAITIGSGGSAGKEGPIVQIGASFGSSIGQAFKLSSRDTIILVGAGVAGGISATFNAPIGGIMFALELILPEYSIMTIMPLVVSAIIATTVGSTFMGSKPSFIIPEYAMESPIELIFYIALGLLAGFLSVLFIKAVYGLEDFFDGWKINPTFKAILGGLIVGAIGYSCLLIFGNYHVFGVGYDFLDLILDNQITVLLVPLSLIFLKILANAITLGAGGSGGIFAPSLFLGGALGASVGILVNTLFPGTTGPIAAYAIVGMAALVSGVTGGVLTAIIMVFEMTRDYAIMLPLLLSGVISFFTAQLLYPETMYTEKLTRRGIPIKFDKRIPTLKTVLVREIMKSDVISCHPTDSVDAVLRIMLEKNLGLLPVVDGKSVLGTVSYKDLYQLKDQNVQTISSLTKIVDISIPGSATMFDALEVMETTKTNILLVTSDSGIIGFVTTNRIIQSYLQKRRLS